MNSKKDNKRFNVAPFDPLWIFDHSNMLNKLQRGLNEKASKTSYIIIY